MDITTKSIHLDIKAIDDGVEGTFEGYGAVFGNVDSYGDVIVKGAFKKTIAERGNKIKMFWNHNSNEVIGVFDEMKEDTTGLFVKGRLALGTQRGKEAHELMKMGAIDSMSIGYKTLKEEYDREKNIRYLKETKLYEMSLVPLPANEEANVTSVKSAFDDLDNINKAKVLEFIKSLDGQDKPQDDSQDTSVGSEEVKETTIDEHSDDTTADNNKTDDPQDLEEIKQSLTQALKTIKGQNDVNRNGSKESG